MRFTSDVDIPAKVLAAQRAGELVIFVGAGASVDSPSNLPLFSELVTKIVDEAQRQRDFPNDEVRTRPDWVLGNLDVYRIPVHQRICEIISRPDSVPNRVHSAIARLFSSADKVRIVTTNYDKHLETVLKKQWPNDVIEVHKAPALPLASDFSGLVYLHGSVAQEPTRLVATDQDFGRAYLTEGWAARFVHELFRERIVLFIGYSHNDPVMTYLARGLTRKNPGRFVLASDDKDSSQWNFLGIEVIPYPVSGGNGQKHLALTKALEEWSNDVGGGIREHAERIKLLCSDQLPPTDIVKESYLKDVIENQNRAALFAEYAHGNEWVKWLLGHDSVKVLFQRNATLSPVNRCIAGWLVREILSEPESFACQTPVYTSGMATEMWDRLAHGVWQLAKIDLVTVDKWIPILLETAPDNTSVFLEYILQDCRWPEDLPKALLLIDWLLDSSTTIPRFQVGNRDRSYNLKKIWGDFFDPNLVSCGAELMPILVRHLGVSHRRIVVADQADQDWDWVSRGRSAIEGHEQDSGMLKELDLLIDGCRDVLVTLLRSDPEVGQGYLRSFEQSETPILRRIAVHAWSERTDVSPDTSLEWLVSKKLVWDDAARHEVFRLVRTLLPSATLPVKQQFLDQVLDGPISELSDNESNPETKDYRIFQYLAWVTNSDPQFKEASAALLDLQNCYPAFVPEEHADMQLWIQSIHTKPSLKWGVYDLLGQNPEEVLSNLMPYENSPSTFFESGWQDVRLLVSEAVRQSARWGLQLLYVLRARELWQNDLWNSVVYGWNLGTLVDVSWDEILDMLLAHSEPIRIRHSAVQLIERGFQRQDVPLKFENLAKAGSLARILWEVTDDDDEAMEPNSGWLDGAINDWSGRLALFWIYVIEARQGSMQSDWSGLDNELREVLGTLITGHYRKHAFARAVIASRLELLNSADPGWITDCVIPLFDWERSSAEANQAWDGLLGIGGTHPESLLPKLMPFYLQCIRRTGNGKGLRDRLLSHLVDIALNSSIEKFGVDGWLDKAIAWAGEGNREKWARSLYQRLKTAPPAVAEASFSNWILKYWQRRINGIPTALSPEEAFEMVDWTLPAGAKFPDVVKLLSQTPIKRSQSHRIFIYELAESGMADRYPTETAQLLHRVLCSLDGPVAHSEELKSLIIALSKITEETGIAQISLDGVLEEAIRLGFGDAMSW